MAVLYTCMHAATDEGESVDARRTSHQRNNVGSAKMTAGGTSPILVATTAVL
jgi:hypothetical protein